MKTEYFESAEVSDVGRKRKNNEDACLCIPERGIFCVADGMGGQAGGDLASDAITTNLQQVFTKAAPEEDATFSRRIGLFRKAVNQASKWIKNFADEKVIGQMGSTVVALIIDPRNPARAAALHAGDSRLYRFRTGELKQITADHSAIEALAAKLGITPDKIPAKYQNELLRAVGLNEAVQLEKTRVDIASGDLYLLCSDGLDKMQTSEQITKILKAGVNQPLAALAQALINAANEAGGKDNVTVVLVKAGDLSGAPNVIDPDEEEEEEEKTFAAEPTTTVEAPTPSNYTPQIPATTDTADVHGDTPATPYSAGSGPEKATADNPATPFSAPTPISIPDTKTAPENPSARKEAKPEIKTSQKPGPKKSFPTGIVIVAALLMVGGAGIWFGAGAKKNPAAADKFSTKPAVSNLPTITAATIPTKPATPAITPAAAAQAGTQAAGRETLKNAQVAFDRRDYKTALTLAAAALEKIPGDPAAAKLQAEAQAQMKLRAAYTAAYKNAESAIKAGDYTNAVDWANEALKLFPNDKDAEQLRKDAQKRLDDYRTAVAAANAAAQQNKHENVVAEANKALAIYPNDAAMLDLKKKAQQKIADLRAYAAAMVKAEAAINGGDYTNAVAWAGKALKQFSADARAQQMRDKAQNKLDVFHAAVAAANSADQKKDYKTAEAESVKALAIYPNDAALLDLKKKAQANDAQANQAEKQKRLQQTIGEFEKMLVWFSIKKPTDRYIKSAEARKERPANGVLSEEQRQWYLKRVTALEDEFGTTGILNQNDRSKYLKELKDTIAQHE